MVLVPNDVITSRPRANATYANRRKCIRQRARKRREACRRFKVDPAIASKVDLCPTMRISAMNNMLTMLRIVCATGISYRYTCRDTEGTSHHRHGTRKVVTETLITAVKQKP